MVTFDIIKIIGNRKNADGSYRTYVEGACLSTDNKPINVDNGSKLLEMDTGTLYIFDLDSVTWRAWR